MFKLRKIMRKYAVCPVGVYKLHKHIWILGLVGEVISGWRGRGKGGCWVAEALRRSDKSSCGCLCRDLLTVVVTGRSWGVERNPCYHNVLPSSLSCITVHCCAHKHTHTLSA